MSNQQMLWLIILIALGVYGWILERNEERRKRIIAKRKPMWWQL